MIARTAAPDSPILKGMSNAQYAWRKAHADCVPIPGDVLHSDEPLFATNNDGDDLDLPLREFRIAPATSGSALRETISSRLRSPM